MRAVLHLPVAVQTEVEHLDVLDAVEARPLQLVVAQDERAEGEETRQAIHTAQL